MTVRQRTGNTQELPAAQMQRVSNFAALAQRSRLRRFCRRQQNRRRVAVRSHPGRAADRKPGAASARSAAIPAELPAESPTPHPRGPQPFRQSRQPEARRRIRAVRSHSGRAAGRRPGAASARSAAIPAEPPAGGPAPHPRGPCAIRVRGPRVSPSRAHTRRLLLRAALSRPLPGDLPAFSPPLPPEKISPCVCAESCRRLPGLPSHEPEGGGVLFRQRSPSAVSFRVVRSCIASCAAVDRLRRFHRQYAYSG